MRTLRFPVRASHAHILVTTLLRIALAVAAIANLTCGVNPAARTDHSARTDDPADLIAFAGHGAVFDKNMKEVQLDTALIGRIQDAIIKRIRTARAREGAGGSASVLWEAEKLLGSRTLTTTETIVIKSGMIRTLLTDASEDVAARYAAPNREILSDYLNRNPQSLTHLRPDVVDVARRLGGVYPPGPLTPGVLPDGQTFYMHLCRLAGVPIPPDWAEEGTAWVRQGNLTTKLILAEKDATVWTYSDPRVPGACIALPRGHGDSSLDALGIICQGLNSGAACFWDNFRRGEAMRIPWRDARLVISELQDATNLSEVCTGCHRGDNVFLITPDDPTWARVLRGPRTGTFTTQADPTVGPRPDPDLAYLPITGWRDRSGWEIPRLTTGCAAGCHLESGLFREWASENMPPECATGPAGAPLDVRRCYGVP